MHSYALLQFFIILLEVILGHELTNVDIVHSQGEDVGKASVDEIQKFVCVCLHIWLLAT